MVIELIYYTLPLIIVNIVHIIVFCRENASEIMIELLRTYPEDGAVEAKDDATNCIVSFIDRPNIWIIDHLLELGPVRSLKGELIYQVKTPLI